MSMQRVKKVLADGTVKTYEYQPRSYYVPEIERCREALERRPLEMFFKKKYGTAWWRTGRFGPRKVFSDRVVSQLIREGYAVCVGKFVEKKGARR